MFGDLIFIIAICVMVTVWRETKNNDYSEK